MASVMNSKHNMEQLSMYRANLMRCIACFSTFCHWYPSVTLGFYTITFSAFQPDNQINCFGFYCTCAVYAHWNNNSNGKNSVCDQFWINHCEWWLKLRKQTQYSNVVSFLLTSNKSYMAHCLRALSVLANWLDMLPHGAETSLILCLLNQFWDGRCEHASTKSN